MHLSNNKWRGHLAILELGAYTMAVGEDRSPELLTTTFVGVYQAAVWIAEALLSPFVFWPFKWH